MKTWSSVDVPRLPQTDDPVGPPTIRVYDTAKGALLPAGGQVDGTPGSAQLYVCGITPYDATHMGHAATYVTFDLLVRAWRDAGLEVTYVQNVTDIDEPLLERAASEGIDWQDLAEREIALFFEDMEALRVVPPHHYVGAVEGIPDDVTAIEELLARGAVYAVPVPDDEATVEGAQRADLYLELATQPTFGTVSTWTREQMMEVFGERGGDPDREGKRDPLDPLLWRAGREGEPHWDGASLGRGRPGWHIECSTIAQRYLGTEFDIQGGGSDLIFPHHEMSAVQAEALSGKPFARRYVHQAMVALDGEKMSKSKGNLVLVSRLREEGVDPMAIRLVLLDQHYRTEWEWTDDLLRRAQDRLAVWRSAAEGAGAGGSELASATLAGMRERLADDLDSPGALRAVDAWAKAVLENGPGDSSLIPRAVDSLLGVRLG